MELAYDRRGSGPPLVLVHPLGADRRVWDPVVDAVAAERHVVCVDLPGFGRSAPLHEPTPLRLAGALREFVRGLGLERVHVAGNSLGGWVALELALLPVLPALVRTVGGRRAALAGTVARPDRVPPAAALHLVHGS